MFDINLEYNSFKLTPESPLFIHGSMFTNEARTTVSQDVKTRFPVYLAFAKFLSRIKGNF